MEGKLPKGVTEEVFVKRLLNSESFANIVKPVVNTIYNVSGRDVSKEPEGYRKGVNSLMKLIENKTIITCISEDQKYLDEKASNKDNPLYKPDSMSPDVRKIRSEYMKRLEDEPVVAPAETSAKVKGKKSVKASSKSGSTSYFKNGNTKNIKKEKNEKNQKKK